MPKLPVIVAERGINTGTTGAQASPRDFYGGGLEDVAGAMGSVANTALRVSQVKEAQAELDGKRWANDRIAELDTFITDTTIALANDEEGGAKAQKAFEAKLAEIEAQAPNRAAADSFRPRAQTMAGNGYSMLAKNSASLKVSNMMTAVDTMAQSAIDNGSKIAATPNALLDYGNYIRQSVYRVHDSIDQQFSGQPALAKKLKDQTAEQFFYGAINAGKPDVAAGIATKFIDDEAAKARLLARAKESSAQNNLLLANDIQKQAKFAEDQALQGKPVAIPSDEAFRAAYGERWELPKQQYMDGVRTSAAAFQMVESYRGKNAQAIQRELSAAGAAAKTPDEAIAIQKAASAAKAMVEQANSNTAAYLAQNNPIVRQLGTQAAAAVRSGDPQAIVDANRKMADAIIKYSGFKGEPADYDEAVAADDSDYYMRKPDLLIDILDREDAKAKVAMFQSGNAEQVGQQIDQMLALYAPEHHPIIMAQLQREGLRGDYLALARSSDNPTTYKRTLESQKQDLKGALGKYNRSDVSKAVSSDANIKNFMYGLTQGGQERGAEAAQMMGSLEQYAASYVNEGKTPKEAAKLAYQDHIAANYATTTVNGHGTFFSAKRRGGRPFEPEEVDAISKNLKLALYGVDPNQIDLSTFPAIKAMAESGDEKAKESALNVLQRDIIEKGKLYPDPDGMGFSLWVEAQRADGSRTMVDTQVQAKNGRALRLRLEHIPTYEVQLGAGVNPLRPDGDLFRSRQSGAAGMVNLLNPMSPQNIANRIYGTEGMNLFGGLYFGSPGATGGGSFKSFYGDSNWPTWTPKWRDQ